MVQSLHYIDQSDIGFCFGISGYGSKFALLSVQQGQPMQCGILILCWDETSMKYDTGIPFENIGLGGHSLLFSHFHPSRVMLPLSLVSCDEGGISWLTR